MTGFDNLKPMTQTQENDQILVELREIKKYLKNSWTRTPLSDWLSSEDVCNMLQISRRLLQEYRNSGELVHSKIGGKVFFHAKDVEKFIRRHQYKKVS